MNSNHEILGIHLDGNEGRVDAEGFVKEFDILGVKDSEKIQKNHVFTRIRPDL